MKNNNHKTLLWVVLALLLIGLIVVAAFAYNHLKDKVDSGNLSKPSLPSSESEGNDSDTVKAPDFTMLDYDGNEVKLSELFGRPIVLNMWASWCPPCKAELPDFEDSFKERDDIQFVILNLTDNNTETVETAKQYIEGEGFTFPVFFDIHGEAAYKYGASSIPMTFFIDADGNVITHAVGMINAATLKQGIDMIS